jgi:hypothetical protein
MKLVVLVLACGALLLAQAVRMTSVEPQSGKPGDTMTVSGEGLTKQNVEKVFLTDGKNDLEVKVVEQVEKAIKFNIPASAKSGRFGLMILTGGSSPKYIEQPVKLTVE